MCLLFTFLPSVNVQITAAFYLSCGVDADIKTLVRVMATIAASVTFPKATEDEFTSRQR